VAPRWLFNVSGNHDIGWRIDHSLQEKLVKTYETHFGELNYVTRVGNFTFVGTLHNNLVFSLARDV
jgi:hypothetical protein